jgi:predicted P-loop ATPase
MIHAIDRDGRVHITCPFADEHTTEGGSSATTYFPAMTGGFEQGHFSCLHAHCSARHDDEFIQRLGIIEAQFNVIVASPDAPLPDLLPTFARDKFGNIPALIDNVCRALKSYAMIGQHLGYDEFSDAIMMTDDPHGRTDWRNFTDIDYTDLRVILEAKFAFKPISGDMIKDAIRYVAARQFFDSAQLWLNAQKWDGVNRIDQFLHKYFSAPDTEYSIAVSRYWWSAMAGRVLVPACQADMVPVLVGEQGIQKSRGVAAMVPSPAHFAELDLADKDGDIARVLKGVLLAELSEMKGLYSKDQEHIKAMITRKHEKWVPKFKEFATRYPRRAIFVGTHNKAEFLVDDTGHRRWLPVTVGETSAIEIARDCNQLWAEARELYLESGVIWADAERLAKEVHEKYTVIDTWEPSIAEWLDGKDMGQELLRGERHFNMATLLAGALNIPAAQTDQRKSRRAGAVLTKLGFKTTSMRLNGIVNRVWIKKIPSNVV